MIIKSRLIKDLDRSDFRALFVLSIVGFIVGIFWWINATLVYDDIAGHDIIWLLSITTLSSLLVFAILAWATGRRDKSVPQREIPAYDDSQIKIYLRN